MDFIGIDPKGFKRTKHFFFVSCHKIQPKVRSSLAETFKCYKAVMHMFVPLTVTIIVLIEGRDFLITIFFLTEDYTNYWFHRFLHKNWGDEKIHGVHHE
ncbi:hypothetical protein JHK82_050300 [Glycine max]|nr:hypothetical protein JHK82_050300 [Glycine max]KAG5094614.1 hypothetical protein JHK84_050202 [Glycine max]